MLTFRPRPNRLTHSALAVALCGLATASDLNLTRRLTLEFGPASSPWQVDQVTISPEGDYIYFVGQRSGISGLLIGFSTRTGRCVEIKPGEAGLIVDTEGRSLSRFDGAFSSVKGQRLAFNARAYSDYPAGQSASPYYYNSTTGVLLPISRANRTGTSGPGRVIGISLDGQLVYLSVSLYRPATNALEFPTVNTAGVRINATINAGSGDGTAIAYTDGTVRYHRYLAQATGTVIPADLGSPVGFLGGGRYVVMASDRRLDPGDVDSAIDYYRWDADTGAVVYLTPGTPTGVSNPVCAPDGSSLTYVHGTEVRRFRQSTGQTDTSGTMNRNFRAVSSNGHYVSLDGFGGFGDALNQPFADPATPGVTAELDRTGSPISAWSRNGARISLLSIRALSPTQTSDRSVRTYAATDQFLNPLQLQSAAGVSTAGVATDPFGRWTAFVSEQAITGDDTDGAPSYYAYQHASGTYRYIAPTVESQFRTFELVFSPDGNSAYYSTAADIPGIDTNGVEDLHRIDLASGARTWITSLNAGAGAGGKFLQPTLNAAGDQLVFWTTNRTYHSGIPASGLALSRPVLLNLNTGLFTPLTADPNINDVPSESVADARRVPFAGWLDANRVAFTMITQTLVPSGELTVPSTAITNSFVMNVNTNTVTALATLPDGDSASSLVLTAIDPAAGVLAGRTTEAQVSRERTGNWLIRASDLRFGESLNEVRALASRSRALVRGTYLDTNHYLASYQFALRPETIVTTRSRTVTIPNPVNFSVDGRDYTDTPTQLQYQRSVDGGAWTTIPRGTTSIPSADLGTGLHQIRYRAINRAGREDLSPVTAIVEVRG
ncbi:MAG: hypothetical protein SFX74_12250 [Fimbriimonadaceae bacterium]|nr:hypothetical protein [Fimbriimonadaceae bacterium]